VRAQTMQFSRLLRDFERFYALTARDGGNDWAIYEAPLKLSAALAQSKEHAASESIS